MTNSIESHLITSEAISSALNEVTIKIQKHEILPDYIGIKTSDIVPSFQFTLPYISAFSLEIVIKHLLAKKGISCKTHNLEKLFNKLDEEVRDAIKEDTIEKLEIPKEEFFNRLKKNAMVFEDWRYIHEPNNRADSASPYFLNAVARSIIKYMKKENIWD